MVVLELFEGVIDILGFHVPVMVQQVQINHLNHKQCPDAKAAGKRPVGIRSTIKFSLHFLDHLMSLRGHQPTPLLYHY